MPQSRIVTNGCLLIIAILSTTVALKLGQSFLAPTLLAMVLGVMIAPLSDYFMRFRLPAALAALLTLLLAIFALVTLLFLIEPTISEAATRAPIILSELQETMRQVRSTLQGLESISGDVVASIGPGEDGNMPVAIPTVTDALLYAPQALAQILIFIGVLYFFLLSRMDVYAWFASAIPQLLPANLHLAEKRVARYFLTITMINACFGLIIGVTMHFVGLPSPVLWGVLAFSLNYILYLGPALLAVGLLVTGVVVFDGPTSFLPPAIYLAMNATEGQFITPALVGKSMSVNPLLIFLSLVFWLWMWGPIGGFIAIPLLIWMIALKDGILSKSPEADIKLADTADAA